MCAEIIKMTLPEDLKAAEEMIRSELARVGIAMTLEELKRRDTDLDESRTHWSQATSSEILEAKALQIIEEARKAFREWAEAKRKMETNFSFGKGLMVNAAANLRDAALLTGKKPGEK